MPENLELMGMKRRATLISGRPIAHNRAGHGTTGISEFLQEAGNILPSIERVLIAI